ncbi:MAG TPA: 50S ribosomal protein L25 [Candidatus Limnocylindrales bacterium]|nr:50S ribosomal protein L25 [Candidatus Limnocylindrales bacterium]
MSQDTIELTLEPRTITGKQVRQLRRDGIIPAVIHDHGKASVLVQADQSELRKVIQQAGRNHPVKLKAGAKNYTAMIKDIEVEPEKQMLTHIVFNAVGANEKVEAEIPVHPAFAEGNDSTPAERNGLMVLTHATHVLVSAVSSKLPEEITYDAESLVAVGDHITVSDLKAPAGVEILTDPSQSIVAVADPDAVAAANDAAGGDAVEADAALVESEKGAVTKDELDGPAAEAQPDVKAENQDKGE